MDRTRGTTYDNDVWGGNVQADLVFNTGPVAHRLIVGGDYSLSTQSVIRDGSAGEAQTAPALAEAQAAIVQATQNA